MDEATPNAFVLPGGEGGCGAAVAQAACRYTHMQLSCFLPRPPPLRLPPSLCTDLCQRHAGQVLASLRGRQRRGCLACMGHGRHQQGGPTPGLRLRAHEAPPHTLAAKPGPCRHNTLLLHLP